MLNQIVFGNSIKTWLISILIFILIYALLKFGHRFY